MTGPFIGPMLHIEKAVARYSSDTKSAIVPGALAIMALPNSAPKNRTTMMLVMSWARAAGRTRIVNMAIHNV
jgi:hypothetical protein